MTVKHIKTVPIHARVAESDVQMIDRAAEDNLTTRSNMVARIIREWAKQQAAIAETQKAR